MARKTTKKKQKTAKVDPNSIRVVNMTPYEEQLYYLTKEVQLATARIRHIADGIVGLQQATKPWYSRLKAKLESWSLI